MLIYGLVHRMQCGSEVAYKWRYSIVNANAETSAKQNIKEDLNAENPGSPWVMVSSSSYDYNTDAKAVCIVKYFKKAGTRSYSGYSIDFGETRKEAFDNATENEDEWASFVIEKQLDF